MCNNLARLPPMMRWVHLSTFCPPAAPLVQGSRGVTRGTVGSIVFHHKPKHRSRAIRAANRYVRPGLSTDGKLPGYVRPAPPLSSGRGTPHWPGRALSGVVDGPLILPTIHVKIHGSVCTIRPILAVSARFSPNALGL